MPLVIGAAAAQIVDAMTIAETADDATRRSGPRLHWAWVVAAVSFVAILGAAGFRSVPGVFMHPLHEEFGWSHGVIGLAMSVNMTLFGLTAPFAAALMDRFGVRPVLATALVLISAGSALSVTMTTSWQLVLLWGVLVGTGTGAISMGFVATIATRWFEARRGLVTGVLTAASATGQLIFLPVIARVTEGHGWRLASLIVAGAALGGGAAGADIHAKLAAGQGIRTLRRPTWGRNRPGQAAGQQLRGRVRRSGAGRPGAGVLAAGRQLRDLRDDHQRTDRHPFHSGRQRPRHADDGRGRPAGHRRGARRRGHHLLRAGSPTGSTRGYCLSSTTSAAGCRCWRCRCCFLPQAQPGTWVFIIFYGLDWVATVPPTIALCREYFGARAPIVFGWVFAAHQLGAAVAAAGAGWLRDLQGDYDLAFYLAAGLCAVAALLCLSVRRVPAGQDPVQDLEATPLR